MNIQSSNLSLNADESLIKSFIPTGRLRASINVGNPILANLDSDRLPFGVSVDLAREFARQIGVELELKVFDSAGKSVEAVTKEEADIGFFAVDPLRGESINFTDPYALIEGAYLVRDASSLRDNAEVDQLGNRVVVGKGSAYDLHLTRELTKASIFRAATSPAVVDTFLKEGLEVAAGVKQQLQADAARVPGLRILPGRFMVIQQAMGLPRSRGDGAAVLLRRFVEEMKGGGFIEAALIRHQIQGASVAETVNA
jgi:polar amino acid transport system substrate-binding protein